MSAGQREEGFDHDAVFCPRRLCGLRGQASQRGEIVKDSADKSRGMIAGGGILNKLDGSALYNMKSQMKLEYPASLKLETKEMK